MQIKYLESVSFTISCWKGRIHDRIRSYTKQVTAIRNKIKGQIIEIPDLMISTDIVSLFLKGQILIYVEFISILTLKKDKSISAKLWENELTFSGAICTDYQCCLVEKE